MCSDSGLKLLVTQESLLETVAAFGVPTVCLDRDAAAIAIHSDEPVAREYAPSDVAYVIYTSGSTGKPKGVQVPHGAAVNFLWSMRETPGLNASDVLLAVTTLSFDISVLETFLPLVVGATCVVLDRETIGDGERLAAAMERYGATVMQATPSTWRMLIEAGWKGRPGLRVLCGGEPFPPDLVAAMLSRVSELWNMYGPTETTVWSTCHRLQPSAPILIGKPIANTQVYLLDSRSEPVPAGVPGELYIGGAGVTLGYLNRGELTAEKFVENPWHDPFAEYVNPRLYRTGDLARWTHDGHIEFFRRIDKQVKVRGHRIELGEIEQALRTHEAVKQTVVIVREDRPGDARLVAYVVLEGGAAATSSELRNHLRQTLPQYMIPQHIVELEKLPQTANGKIDHKALPSTSHGASSEPEERALPETTAQTQLAAIWSELLNVSDIGLHDNFFNIGGHSLLAMRVISRVEEQTGVRLSPRDLLLSTLEQVAAKLPQEALAEHQSVEKPQPAKEPSSGLFKKLKKFFG